MSIEGRKGTPALGLRILQPYVPLRFVPSGSVPEMDISSPRAKQKGKIRHVQKSIYGYEFRRPGERGREVLG